MAAMDTSATNPDSLQAVALVTAAVLIVLNMATFMAFALDKQRDTAGESPLSEMWLLSLAALGGWPGAKLAQMILRHKTRKEPFRTMLNMVALPLVAVAGLVAYEEVDFAAVWSVIDKQLSAQIASAETPAPEVPAAAPAPVAAKPPGPDDPALPQRFGPGASAKNGGAWKSK